MAKVLRRHGYLFLKTFSVKIPSPGGPYRYTPKMIHDYFYEKFEIVDTYETTFQSTMEKDPIAIFTVLKKK